MQQRARPASLLTPGRIGVLGYSRETAGDKPEEGAGDGRSVCPESPGLHTGYRGPVRPRRPRKGEVIGKPARGWDRRLQLAAANMECVVTACHQRAVNTSLDLALTARRRTRPALTRSLPRCGCLGCLCRGGSRVGAGRGRKA